MQMLHTKNGTEETEIKEIPDILKMIPGKKVI